MSRKIYIPDEKVFGEAAKIIATRASWYNKIMKAHPEFQTNLPIDPRDLFYASLLLSNFGNPDVTEDQYQAMLEGTVQALRKDKKTSLDRIYDIFENVDTAELDNKTVSSAIKTFTLGGFNQGFCRTLDDFNKDYKKQRYGTVEQKERFDYLLSRSFNHHCVLEHEARLKGFNFTRGGRAPKIEEYLIGVDKEYAEFRDNIMDAYTAYCSGEKANIEIEIPEITYATRTICERTLNNPLPVPEKYANYYGNSNIFNFITETIQNPSSFGNDFNKIFRDNTYRNIYVQGRPLEDWIKTDDHPDGQVLKGRKDKFLAEAILEGKEMDFVRYYKDGNNITPEIIPLTFRKSQAQLDKEFAAYKASKGFWRNLFDWGWFKIKRPEDTLSTQNALNEESRAIYHGQIKAYAATELTRIVRDQELANVKEDEKIIYQEEVAELSQAAEAFTEPVPEKFRTEVELKEADEEIEPIVNDDKNDVVKPEDPEPRP